MVCCKNICLIISKNVNFQYNIKFYPSADEMVFIVIHFSFCFILEFAYYPMESIRFLVHSGKHKKSSILVFKSVYAAIKIYIVFLFVIEPSSEG